MYRFVRAIMLLAAGMMCQVYAQAQNAPRMLIVNHNAIFNYATFFQIEAGGNLTSPTLVSTGGYGTSQENIGGVAAFHSTTQDCFFIADGASNAVAAIDSDFNVIADFHAGPLDFGVNGLSLAVNKEFLYAGFGGNSQSGGNSRMASFRIEPGCNLEYLGSVPAVGLGSGIPNYLATRGKILVVSYGDGSIESFHFSKGLAQSNGDLQKTTGATKQLIAVSVDVSKDGTFAVFGDRDNVHGRPVVEVADISSGKLGQPTVVYRLGSDFLLSTFVRLSPDESLLYLSGGEGGDPPLKTLGAAFFDRTTGTVKPGCFAPPLNDPNQEWGFTTNVAFANNSKGLGATLYVMEVSVEFIGGNQSLATVNVQSNGKSCSFQEAGNSPLTLESGSFDFGTITSSPPRTF